MDHRLRILTFLFLFFCFSHLIKFFKALTDLEFLILTQRLFHSVMQYRGKKVFLKDFVLDKGGLITEADTNLKK